MSFIARHVEIKSDVVKRDERENGARMLLNLGHTFAHAIETRPELGLEHGEAVALGIVAACAAGERLGVTGSGLRTRLCLLFTGLGLPTCLPSRPLDEEVIASMRSDKKARAGSIRLIIPVDAGIVQVVDDAPEEIIRDALEVIAPSR